MADRLTAMEVFVRAVMDLGAAYALTHPSRRLAAKTRAWIDHLTQCVPPLAASW